MNEWHERHATAGRHEAVAGFLVLVALAMLVGPLVFRVPADARTAVHVAQAVITILLAGACVALLRHAPAPAHPAGSQAAAGAAPPESGAPPVTVVDGWSHSSDVGRGEFPDGRSQVRVLPEATLFLFWIPTVRDTGFPAMTRTRLLARVSDSGLVTGTSPAFDLPNALARRPVPDALAAVALPVRTTLGLLAFVGDRYKFVAERQEDEMRRLEERRLNVTGHRFLTAAYQLQREISVASADVWRLRGIIHKIADRKVPLKGLDANAAQYVDHLRAELDDLDREFLALRDDLKALLELHMNVSAFEMNKFMKVLAIVGCIGLIPAVAGGLLGMNVAGNPWAVTLGQVAFGVVMASGITLYVFMLKGWFRS